MRNLIKKYISSFSIRAENFNIILRNVIVTVFFLCLSNKTYSQVCNMDLTTGGNYSIGVDSVGCLSADITGTISIKNGGILIICGQFIMTTAIDVQPGGKIILTAGSSVGYTGVISMNSSGIAASSMVDFSGDPSCKAELYKAGLSSGTITGPSPALGAWVTSNDSQIYLDGFFYAWGAPTYGAVNVTRAPTPLCPGISSCESVGSSCIPPSFVDIQDGARCGIGSVTLGAQADVGTISWFATPLSTTVLQTGNSFTTPSISTTTVYYVEADNGSCSSFRVPVVATIEDSFVDAGTGGVICGDNLKTTLSGVLGERSGITTWTTSGSGSFGANEFNLNPVYTCSQADSIAGSVTLTLSSTGALCPDVQDQVTFSIMSKSLNAGLDQSVCSSNPNATLSGTENGLDGYYWATSGSGWFSPNVNDINAVYTAGANDLTNGSVELTLSSTDLTCAPNSDKLTIYYTANSYVNAGVDEVLCSDNLLVNLSGDIGSQSGVTTWSTNGSGSFSPDEYQLDAVYSFSIADSIAGAVTLTLSLTGTSCNDALDQVTYSIQSKVLAAGPDQTVCSSSPNVTLAGTETGTDGIVWNTSGSGSFSPDPSVLSAMYVPSNADITAGGVILTLNSTDLNCPPPNSSLNVYYTDSSISAGVDKELCPDDLFVNLTGDIGSQSGVTTWSTNGSGSFSPDASKLDAVYSFSMADSIAGSVTLTLSISGGSCSDSQDQVTYNVLNKSLNAGEDQSVCTDSPNVKLVGQEMNTTGVNWVTSGTGAFFPDKFSLNAEYRPSGIDLSAGSVTLSLISIDPICPLQSDMNVLFNESPRAGMLPVTYNVSGGSLNQIRVDLSGDFPMSFRYDDGVNSILETGVTSTPYFIEVLPNVTTKYTVDSVISVNGCSAKGELDTTELVLSKKISVVVFPDQQASFEDGTVQMVGASNNPGIVSFDIFPDTCASISSTGLVTFTCVDTFQVRMITSATDDYFADTSYAELKVSQSETYLAVAPRGGVAGGNIFQIETVSNFDGQLTYTIIGDTSIAKVSSDGKITPLSPGVVKVYVEAKGSVNYQDKGVFVEVQIYDAYFPPVVEVDSIFVITGESGNVNLLDNDYGITGVIVPELIDIDTVNAGIQNQFFIPSVGYFLVDSYGILTFEPFEAFVGETRLGYRVYDDNGYSSNVSYVYAIVDAPIKELALKVNEIMTPNGDNKNDALVVGYADMTQSNELHVFDRAGNEVYYEKNYRNDWMGVDLDGDDLAAGVYLVYFKEYHQDSDSDREVKIYVHILR